MSRRKKLLGLLMAAGLSAGMCVTPVLAENTSILEAVADEELTFKGTKHGAAFFIDCYELHRDLTLDDLTLQTEEVSGAKFVTLAEFEKMQKEKKLIPGLFDFMTELEFSFVTGKITCPKGNKK